MDIEKAKEEFLLYVQDYNLEGPKVKLKYHHSLRVMDCAKRIAESLKLNEQEIEIATLIGLLHDVGRFEQIKRYNSLNDIGSIDHGDLGLEILQKDNYIRKYIDDNHYDRIIYKAVKNHNKYKIEDGLSDEELLFAKIVRDADKLDIFYEGVKFFWNSEDDVKSIENSKVTDKIFEGFKQKKLIDRKEIVTPADGLISFIGFIFDLNFKYTCDVINQEKYIDKILDRFNFKDEDTKEKMLYIRNLAFEFLKNKN